jgi:hypothetical protein
VSQASPIVPETPPKAASQADVERLWRAAKSLEKLVRTLQGEVADLKERVEALEAS